MIRPSAFLRIFVLALVLLAVPGRAPSYVYSGTKWPDGNIVMQLDLRAPSSTLIDGSTSWGQPAEAALAAWNSNISRAHFLVVRDSTASTGLPNNLNNVFWSSNAYGKNFNDYASPTQGGTIIGLTLTWVISGRVSEADVIFNNTQPFNSYRGVTRRTPSGQAIIDFRRLAMHEFGHVLGLLHPNDYGQSRTAQMNSNIGDLDTLAADDIQGAQFLWGDAAPPPPPPPPPTTVVVSFPPRNESLDFRNQLEAKYRDGLRRPGLATYVDNEGDVVWTQEYLRYRVNQCSHSVAVGNVMTEINGSSSPAVCGSVAAGTVNFPPRNESLDFRNQLEAKYRDGLRRSPGSSTVDLEGDVVWTQEYLRFRVNGCTHGDAVQKVILEIDGRGTQPVCQ